MAEYVEVCNGDFHYQISDSGVSKEEQPHGIYYARANVSLEVKGLLAIVQNRWEYIPDWVFTRKWLKQEMHCSEKKFRRVINQCIKAGFLKIIRDGKGTSYRFTMKQNDFTWQPKERPKELWTAANDKKPPAKKVPKHLDRPALRESI